MTKLIQIFFFEPSIEIEALMFSFLNIIFGLSYKQIEYSIISQRKTDKLNIIFYTERYKFSLSGLYYSAGLYVNIQ